MRSTKKPEFIEWQVSRVAQEVYGRQRGGELEMWSAALPRGETFVVSRGIELDLEDRRMLHIAMCVYQGYDHLRRRAPDDNECQWALEFLEFLPGRKVEVFTEKQPWMRHFYCALEDAESV